MVEGTEAVGVTIHVGCKVAGCCNGMSIMKNALVCRCMCAITVPADRLWSFFRLELSGCVLVLSFRTFVDGCRANFLFTFAAHGLTVARQRRQFAQFGEISQGVFAALSAAMHSDASLFCTLAASAKRCCFLGRRVSSSSSLHCTGAWSTKDMTAEAKRIFLQDVPGLWLILSVSASFNPSDRSSKSVMRLKVR